MVVGIRSRGQFLAFLLSALLLLAPFPGLSSRVEAHCPGGEDHEYAAGAMDLAVASNAIRASIEWTNPNVCTVNSSHSISLTKGGGWIQVGWWKSAGGVVQGYCEVQHPTGGNYDFDVFAVTAATHAYKFQYDAVDSVWDCIKDISGQFSYTLGFVGFSSSSDFVQPQGETYAAHGQIGRMAPAKLLFFDMQYRRASDGQWPAVNIALSPVNAPYGRDEPAVGQLRVWTNAH